MENHFVQQFVVFKNMFPILPASKMDQFIHAKLLFITKLEDLRDFHNDLSLDVFCH